MRESTIGATLRLAVCLALGSVPTPAAAGGAPYIAPPIYTVPGVMYPQLYNVCPNGSCSNGAAGQAPHNSAGTPAGPFITGFAPDPAVRQRVKADFVAELSRRQPAKAQDYAKLFGSRDMIADFDRRYAWVGLRSTDAADAYAAYWLQCWQAANQSPSPVSPAAAKAVKTQVVATMRKSASAALQTPVSRETFAETLIYRTVLLGDGMTEASSTGQADALRQLSDEADHALAGMDQRQLVLTDTGFRKR